MPEPQQPELARSRKGSTSDRSAKSKLTVEGVPASQAPMGPIPEANRPGHHPEVEQDKPTEPPPIPRTGRRSTSAAGQTVDASARAAGAPTRLPFRFRPLLAPAAALFGVTPWTVHVDVDDEELAVRFGPWSVRTSRSNIAGVERTGRFSPIKVAGGPHISFADRGATFATSTDDGVCIRFHRPVRALLPIGPIRHPALTVTVADPDRLVELLQPGGNGAG
jgi:hypothetical protein